MQLIDVVLSEKLKIETWAPRHIFGTLRDNIIIIIGILRDNIIIIIISSSSMVLQPIVGPWPLFLVS
jgi:hypothetical protein